LYDIIIDCNFDDNKIRAQIKEKIKLLKHRGVDFGWNVIDKSHKLKPVDFKNKTNTNENQAHNQHYTQDNKRKKGKAGYDESYYNQQGYNNYNSNNRNKRYKNDYYNNEYTNEYSTPYVNEESTTGGYYKSYNKKNYYNTYNNYQYQEEAVQNPDVNANYEETQNYEETPNSEQYEGGYQGNQGNYYGKKNKYSKDNYYSNYNNSYKKDYGYNTNYGSETAPEYYNKGKGQYGNYKTYQNDYQGGYDNSYNSYYQPKYNKKRPAYNKKTYTTYEPYNNDQNHVVEEKRVELVEITNKDVKEDIFKTESDEYNDDFLEPTPSDNTNKNQNPVVEKQKTASPVKPTQFNENLKGTGAKPQTPSKTATTTNNKETTNIINNNTNINQNTNTNHHINQNSNQSNQGTFSHPNVMNNNQDSFKTNEVNPNINNMGMDQFKKEFEKISLKNNYESFSSYSFAGGKPQVSPNIENK
jgi:hypothetical protein